MNLICCKRRLQISLVKDFLNAMVVSQHQQSLEIYGFETTPNNQ